MIKFIEFRDRILADRRHSDTSTMIIRSMTDGVMGVRIVMVNGDTFMVPWSNIISAVYY